MLRGLQAPPAPAAYTHPARPAASADPRPDPAPPPCRPPPPPPQVIAASTDTEECHLAWIKTPRNRGGLGYMQIPLLADTTKEISARCAHDLKGA
jgi:hypothetical protein